jgi:uncharacterized protein (TIGR03437 family)
MHSTGITTPSVHSLSPNNLGAASKSITRLPLLIFLSTALMNAQLMVDTVAGGKIRTGVPAQDVAFSGISGITADPRGGWVFCETSTNLIRRIRPDGILETVAGNGITGFSGDGGPALNASLNAPAHPGFDAKGNLYFADGNNRRIRRIDTAGNIATIAGNGLENAAALGGPALNLAVAAVYDLTVDLAGNVYIGEALGGVVRRIIPSGRIEVVDAGLDRAALLTADAAGNVYVGEVATRNARIRRIAPDGAITNFAGYGTSTGPPPDNEGKPAIDTSLAYISALAADPAGNVYLIEPVYPAPSTPGSRIRRIDRSGILTTIAGGQDGISPDGPAVPSRITPIWLAADSQGNVAFTESVEAVFAARVREITPQAMMVTLGGRAPKPAPDGTAARDAWFLNPTALAINRAGDVFVAESTGCMIRRIGSNGALSTFAGTGECGMSISLVPNATQDLAPPAAMAFDSQGRLSYVDAANNVYIIAPDAKVTPANFPPVLGPRTQIAIDAKDRVYLLGTFSLLRISPDGKSETIVSPPPQPGVPPQGFGPTLMTAIGIDAARNVYFTGTYLGSPTYYVFRINDDGSFQPVLGNAANPLTLGGSSAGLAADANGNVWLGLSMVNSLGRWTIGRQDPGYSGDGGPAQSARFNRTNAIALAPNGDLQMIDNGRVRRLTGLTPPPAPAISAGGIVNAASLADGSIAPGELVSIFGTNFGATAPQTAAVENNHLPMQLGRTKVLFGGYPGAIVAMTPTQINVFAPSWLEPGESVNVSVQVDTAVSAPVTLPVAKAAPGVSTTDQSGSGPAAALNQDGSVNSSANPAARGTIVSLYGTGEGRVSPSLLWGVLSVSPPLGMPVEPMTVTIGGVNAEVTYAGAAPLLPIGVFQINARIPDSVPPGAAQIVVTVGGVVTVKPVTVAIR